MNFTLRIFCGIALLVQCTKSLNHGSGIYNIAKNKVSALSIQGRAIPTISGSSFAEERYRPAGANYEMMMTGENSFSSRQRHRYHLPPTLSSLIKSGSRLHAEVNKQHSRLSMSIVDSEPIVSIEKSIPGAPLKQHHKLVRGKLDNGFTYIILPNAVPAGRFEAHLEVMSGSANELEKQQGMAHLLEHVAYMGSPKRQMISGTGSRTNAYTDFHHTVFFAACPTHTPDQFWKKPMLPMALDALLDVMTTKIDDHRLEKERAAVLSEASMVNKMEYRVECQILSSLHAENRISARFPIGKEELIRKWSREDLQLYHDTHYQPENVILFVVGDVDVPTTIETIQQKFGALKPKIDAPKLLKGSGEFPDVSMRDVSRHFPPVVHEWSCTDEEAAKLVPPALVKAVDTSSVPTISSSLATSSSSPSSPPSMTPATISASKSSSTEASSSHASSSATAQIAKTSRVFKHELLQSFSFHLFAKRPIEPVMSEAAFKRELLRRMTLSALQIRLNVQQRQQPLFTFIDFNQLNWPREGCAVCSLDMTTDISSWRDAVTMAVTEIRRLGLYGLTASELSRYKIATLSEVAQAWAQTEQMSNEEVLGELMETEACGHTYMHPQDRYETAERVLASVTLEEVNDIARELCEHLSHMQPGAGVRPAAVVACAPIVDRTGQAFALCEDDVAAVIQQAMQVPLEPLEDTPVPDTLISPELLEEKLAKTNPRWVPLEGKALRNLGANGASVPDPDSPIPTHPLGVVQKRLSNGIRVNLFSLPSEPQRASLRIYIPGGRMAETKDDLASVLLGARTIQEGGAFLSLSREEVELFCIDHLVMVDIVATEEALVFDFQSVTTPGPGGKVTGVEAVMQVAHIILTDFIYEDDAFLRARQSFHEQFDSIVKGLESACHESLAFSLTGGDGRFLTPNHKQIDKLDLPTVKNAIVRQLDPAGLEVSMSGDMPIASMQELILRYLGSVPPSSSPTSSSSSSSSSTSSSSATVKRSPASFGLKVKTLGKKEQLGVYLSDSDQRAMGYLAGPAPNRWGIYANGDTVADVMRKASGTGKGGDGGGTKSVGGVGGVGAFLGLKRNKNTNNNNNKGDDNTSTSAGAEASRSVEKSSSIGGVGGRDERREHPLFGHVALAILQEVANRRLFSIVREERQLTYDASFQLQNFDSIRGGWYLVSVTSSPQQVQSAVRACKEALASLRGAFGVMGDSVQSAKRTILNRFHQESATNHFWVDHMSGTQLDDIPLKDLSCIAEFEKALASVTVQDIQLLVEAFDFVEDNMTSCVGVTAPQPPSDMQTQR